jgi:hypothetical protein
LASFEGVERLVPAPVRQRHEYGDAAVHAERRKFRLRRVGYLLFPGARHVPAPRLAAERNGYELSAKRSVAAEMYPADLGKIDGTVVLVQALEFDVFGRQREGVVLELLPRLRIAPKAGKEPLERCVQCAKGVLKGVDGNEVDPVYGGAPAGQFLRLKSVGRENP